MGSMSTLTIIYYISFKITVNVLRLMDPQAATDLSAQTQHMRVKILVKFSIVGL